MRTSVVSTSSMIVTITNMLIFNGEQNSIMICQSNERNSNQRILHYMYLVCFIIINKIYNVMST